ncbi:MAG: flagellar type III secretion system pore protein FliP [Oscillospiraceae bacterium]|nr:flagellar type III secretion system pore protein FliP [Oscillospiraceae bacterium]
MKKTRKTVTLKALYKKNKKLFIRFFASFAVTCFLVTAAFVISAAAAPGENETEVIAGDVGEATNPITPTDTNSALYDLIGVDGSQPLEIALLITILSVAPSILLMMTSFARIIIVFGFMRNAMNTQSTPPNQVLVGLALFLTIYIMAPVFLEINRVAYVPYTEGELTAWEAVETAGGPLKTFMIRNTADKNMVFFIELSDVMITDEEGVPLNDFSDLTYDQKEQLSLYVVIPAFMISELSRAFQMGFMLFIPFLVIDIVVASTLMSMGMMMLPPAMISLPFKIMLFVLVDGWQMLIGGIVRSFN